MEKITVDKNASSVILALLGSPLSNEEWLMQRTYKIRYKGAEVECHSLREATDLLRALGEDKHNPELIPWEAAEFTEFTSQLELYPLRLLAMLLSKNAATDGELRKELGYANNKALAGTLSGISKVALSLDIEPQRVYNQRTSYKHGKPMRMYYIGPMFRKAALDHDWPSETDLNPPDDDDDGRPDIAE